MNFKRNDKFLKEKMNNFPLHKSFNLLINKN